MSDATTLTAEIRHDIGKGASRRLRREQDKVPAIIYGGDEEPLKVTFEHRHIRKALEQEAFYSSILTLNLEGKEQQVVLKDLQRHPSKRLILHMDLLRITGKEQITMRIPLHFIGGDVAPGVKEGGIVSHILNDVEIKCLPKDLPENISIDISQLGLDQTLHLSNLSLPKNTELVATDLDQPIVSIHLPRAAVEEEPEAVTEEEEAEGKEEENGESKET